MRYIAYGERFDSSNVMSIGVSVHELGHTLGLPDLYDYTRASQGVGPHCMMAAGTWGRAEGDRVPGQTPTSLSAWHKIALGYVVPTEVSVEYRWTGALNRFNHNDFSQYNVLKVTSPLDHLQYFLVENRDISTKWDAGLHSWLGNMWMHGRNYTGGILIFHVDESMRISHNANDNFRRKFVDLEEADGSNFFDGRSTSLTNWGDHFFRADNFHNFAPGTNPSSNFYEPRTTSVALERGNHSVVTGITIRVTSNRAEFMTVTVNEFAPLREPVPSAEIDFEAEILTGLEPGSYSISGGAAVAIGDGGGVGDDVGYEIPESWLGTMVSIVRLGDGVDTLDSHPQHLFIPSRPLAPEVEAVQPAVIGGTGSIDGTTAAMEYRLLGEGPWATATAPSITGLLTGTYQVRYAVTSSSFTGPTATMTIVDFVPDPEEAPSAEINFVAEQLTGLTPGSYSFNGGSVDTLAGTTYNIPITWLGTTVSIVRLGNGETTVDSLPQSLYIPARPSAPNLSAEQPTTVGGTGGINGTTAAMEYRLAGDASAPWVAATAPSLTGLQPGTYEVRLRATTDAFIGQMATVTLIEFVDPGGGAPGGGAPGGGAPGGGAPGGGAPGGGAPGGGAPGGGGGDGSDPDETDPDETEIEPQAVPLAEPVDYAEELFKLGLFQGTGVDEDGSPIFSLEAPLNRLQALILTIRLLGLEEEALDFDGPNPFADVTYHRQVPYVAFAFENGLTQGVSANEFAPTQLVTLQEFTTFLLRALGYGDDDVETTLFAEALELAVSIGLYTPELLALLAEGDFLRIDAVAAMVNALLTNTNDTDDTLLIDKLVNSNVIPRNDADAFISLLDGNKEDDE